MTITQQNFIKQLKRKDETALIFVIDEFGWIIKSVIKKQLSSFSDKQGECMNDVLLAIWNHIDSFDENRSSFSNWVAGISRYKALDYKRKYIKYMREIPLDSIESADAVWEDCEKLDREISEEMESMLSCLSAKDQDIFIRLFVEECPASQVAKEIGMETSALYNRVSRARKKLKNLYEKPIRRNSL